MYEFSQTYIDYIKISAFKVIHQKEFCISYGNV